MEKISTIKQLIDTWPTRKSLAAELGVAVDRVHSWAKLGSIPARYHRRICMSAEKMGFPVTAELIDLLHCSDLIGDAA